MAGDDMPALNAAARGSYFTPMYQLFR